MSIRKVIAMAWIDALALIVAGVVFVVPFVFIFLTAAKSSQEASLFQFSWPTQFQLVQNIQDVLAYGDGRMPRTVNLISGPSRTADIEQTIVMGAHGPKNLVVIIAGS